MYEAGIGAVLPVRNADARVAPRAPRPASTISACGGSSSTSTRHRGASTTSPTRPTSSADSPPDEPKATRSTTRCRRSATGHRSAPGLRDFVQFRVLAVDVPRLQDSGQLAGRTRGHRTAGGRRSRPARRSLTTWLTGCQSLLDRLDQLPQTYAHGDASPQNLLIPSGDRTTRSRHRLGTGEAAADRVRPRTAAHRTRPRRRTARRRLFPPSRKPSSPHTTEDSTTKAAGSTSRSSERASSAA